MRFVRDFLVCFFAKRENMVTFAIDFHEISPDGGIGRRAGLKHQ